MSTVAKQGVCNDILLARNTVIFPEKAASDFLLASCKKGDSDLRFDGARNLDVDTQGFQTNSLVSLE